MASKAVEELLNAVEDLLNYCGGWDLKDENHPIVRARNAFNTCVVARDLGVDDTPIGGLFLSDPNSPKGAKKQGE